MANGFELTEDFCVALEVGFCCIIPFFRKLVTKAPLSVLLIKADVILDKTYLSDIVIGMSEFSLYMTTSFVPLPFKNSHFLPDCSCNLNVKCSKIWG